MDPRTLFADVDKFCHERPTVFVKRSSVQRLHELPGVEQPQILFAAEALIGAAVAHLIQGTAGACSQDQVI